MRAERIWVVAVLALAGCQARVVVDEPWVQPPPPPPGNGGAAGGTTGGGGGGGGGGAPVCGFESECDPTADKKAQKASCDDGDPKTVDRCVTVAALGGVCAHTEAECDVFDPVSLQAVVCDDGDPETDDRCTKWNACLSKKSAAEAAPAAHITE